MDVLNLLKCSICSTKFNLIFDSSCTLFIWGQQLMSDLTLRMLMIRNLLPSSVIEIILLYNWQQCCCIVNITWLLLPLPNVVWRKWLLLFAITVITVPLWALNAAVQHLNVEMMSIIGYLENIQWPLLCTIWNQGWLPKFYLLRRMLLHIFLYLENTKSVKCYFHLQMKWTINKAVIIPYVPLFASCLLLWGQGEYMYILFYTNDVLFL